MNFVLLNLIYTFALLIGMLMFLEVGRRIGLRRMAEDKEGARAGIGTVEGAILALLGLLIAFSFSGAAARYDQRRQQIVEEASNIGSAYSLIDLLPPENQEPLRETFRNYVDSRLDAYRVMPTFRPCGPSWTDRSYSRTTFGRGPLQRPAIRRISRRRYYCCLRSAK